MGTDGYSPAGWVVIVLCRPHGAVRLVHGAQIGFSTGAVRLSGRHNASSTGADRLSGRQIGFSATDRLLGDGSHSGCRCLFWARFKFGFDRNFAELGHPRPEAETSPRRRVSSWRLGLLDLHGRRPSPQPPAPPPGGLRRPGRLRRPADLRPPMFSSAPRPANGARPAAPA